MLSKILQESITDLFSKGEFEKVITKIEEFSSFDDRSPGLSSILGVCRMLKRSKSKNDLKLALKDFQSAFNKSSDKNLSIEVLCNFISACLKNIKQVSKTKVDRISIGMLTQSVSAIDVKLEI